MESASLPDTESPVYMTDNQPSTDGLPQLNARLNQLEERLDRIVSYLENSASPLTPKAGVLSENPVATAKNPNLAGAGQMTSNEADSTMRIPRSFAPTGSGVAPNTGNLNQMPVSAGNLTPPYLAPGISQTQLESAHLAANQPYYPPNAPTQTISRLASAPSIPPKPRVMGDPGQNRTATVRSKTRVESFVGRYVLAGLAAVLVLVAAGSLVALMWEYIPIWVKITTLAVASLVLAITGIAMSAPKGKTSIPAATLIGTGAGLGYLTIISAHSYFQVIVPLAALLLLTIWTLGLVASSWFTRDVFTTVVVAFGAIATVILSASAAGKTDINNAILLCVFVALYWVATTLAGRLWITGSAQAAPHLGGWLVALTAMFTVPAINPLTTWLIFLVSCLALISACLMLVSSSDMVVRICGLVALSFCSLFMLAPSIRAWNDYLQWVILLSCLTIAWVIILLTASFNKSKIARIGGAVISGVGMGFVSLMAWVFSYKHAAPMGPDGLQLPDLGSVFLSSGVAIVAGGLLSLLSDKLGSRWFLLATPVAAIFVATSLPYHIPLVLVISGLTLSLVVVVQLLNERQVSQDLGQASALLMQFIANGRKSFGTADAGSVAAQIPVNTIGQSVRYPVNEQGMPAGNVNTDNLPRLIPGRLRPSLSTSKTVAANWPAYRALSIFSWLAALALLISIAKSLSVVLPGGEAANAQLPLFLVAIAQIALFAGGYFHWDGGFTIARQAKRNPLAQIPASDWFLLETSSYLPNSRYSLGQWMNRAALGVLLFIAPFTTQYRGLGWWNIVLGMVIIALATVLVWTLRDLDSLGMWSIAAGFVGLWTIGSVFITWTALKFSSPVISAVILVFGLGCIAGGFRLRTKLLRYFGLATMIAMVLKLVTVDISQANSIVRILALGLGGLLCFGASIGYVYWEKHWNQNIASQPSTGDPSVRPESPVPAYFGGLPLPPQAPPTASMPVITESFEPNFSPYQPQVNNHYSHPHPGTPGT